MPDSDLIIPFITIRRRNDGSVMVTAPALTGGSGPFGARAKMMGLPDKGGDGPPSRAEGRFTIITDGEILTNNSEDGPVADPTGRAGPLGRRPGSSKIPEMLVRLLAPLQLVPDLGQQLDLARPGGRFLAALHHPVGASGPAGR